MCIASLLLGHIAIVLLCNWSHILWNLLVVISRCLFHFICNHFVSQINKNTPNITVFFLAYSFYWQADSIHHFRSFFTRPSFAVRHTVGAFGRHGSTEILAFPVKCFSRKATKSKQKWSPSRNRSSTFPHSPSILPKRDTLNSNSTKKQTSELSLKHPWTENNRMMLFDSFVSSSHSFFFCFLIIYLFGYLVGWLVDWLVGWLIDYLLTCFVNTLV